MKIGFIGTGVIGRAYAEDFRNRGYDVVQYSLEKEFKDNKDKIKDCAITFIAVPTPTLPDKGFNFQNIDDALGLIGQGKIAVIKSTVLPGITDSLQEKYPAIYLFHSPEFLRARSAMNDAKKPERNIIGYTEHSKKLLGDVLSVLPEAKYVAELPAKTAEMIKYAGNVFLATKVVYANFLYDLCQTLGVDYEDIRQALSQDKRIGPSHLFVDFEGGRGAGGMCFIKDIEAFKQFCEKTNLDAESVCMLQSIIEKNKRLLKESGKDTDILKSVYGNNF
jgi:nucleotide sugar dehydrogenase